MAHGELEVLAYVGVEAHDVDVLMLSVSLDYSVDTWPRFVPHSEHQFSAADSVAQRASLHRQTHISYVLLPGIPPALSAPSATYFTHDFPLAYRHLRW